MKNKNHVFFALTLLFLLFGLVRKEAAWESLSSWAGENDLSVPCEQMNRGEKNHDTHDELTDAESHRFLDGAVSDIRPIQVFRVVSVRQSTTQFTSLRHQMTGYSTWLDHAGKERYSRSHATISPLLAGLEIPIFLAVGMLRN